MPGDTGAPRRTSTHRSPASSGNGSWFLLPRWLAHVEPPLPAARVALPAHIDDPGPIRVLADLVVYVGRSTLLAVHGFLLHLRLLRVVPAGVLTVRTIVIECSHGPSTACPGTPCTRSLRSPRPGSNHSHGQTPRTPNTGTRNGTPEGHC